MDSEQELRAKIKAYADGLFDGSLAEADGRAVAAALRLIMLGVYDPRTVIDQREQMFSTQLAGWLAAQTGHTDRHVYLSTGCLHGQHTYCQSDTGAAGTKIPAQCKFCNARCVCVCHKEGYRP